MADFRADGDGDGDGGGTTSESREVLDRRFGVVDAEDVADVVELDMAILDDLRTGCPRVKANCCMLLLNVVIALVDV